MSEMSVIGKIMWLLKSATEIKCGLNLDPEEVVELLGHIKNLEESYGLSDQENKALLSRAEKAEEKVKEWETVAKMLADELNDANSDRLPISWEDASESSPAWIAYVNLRDRR